MDTHVANVSSGLVDFLDATSPTELLGTIAHVVSFLGQVSLQSVQSIRHAAVELLEPLSSDPLGVDEHVFRRCDPVEPLQALHRLDRRRGGRHR